VFAEDFFKGKRIIEVGAGCGLTSIYAALRGANVTLTDMVGRRFCRAVRSKVLCVAAAQMRNMRLCA
jgi:predicted nicotinamide N-methyase